MTIDNCPSVMLGGAGTAWSIASLIWLVRNRLLTISKGTDVLSWFAETTHHYQLGRTGTLK